MWRARLTLEGRRIVVVESDREEGQRIARLLQTWSAQVSVHTDVAGFEREWPADPRRPRLQPPDLLIVGDQVAADTGPDGVPGGDPSLSRSGASLVARLRAAVSADVPAVMLVSVQDSEAGPGPHAFPPDGLHRLQRPVQANRLRALVAFKLSAAGSTERPQ